MKHIMVDLETWGTKPYSTIISIGAVYFDPTKTGDAAIKDEFYVTIDPIASERAGFRKDADTLAWWLQPSQGAAWKEWYETVHLEPQAAFFGLGQWLHGLFDLSKDPTAHDDVQVKERDTFDPAAHIAVWGNGATFDNTLLRQGYELLQMEPPWKHYNDRCFRTMKNLVSNHLLDGDTMAKVRAKDLAPPHAGLKHNALVDARQQALWLCNIAHKFALDL